MARVLLPNVPHHITQRGNRRQQTFFCNEDYEFYLKLLHDNCNGFDVTIEAYCLMPNHVHLILTPSDEEGIRAAVSEIHGSYTRRMNLIKNWKGHFWQGRFFSCPMDENHFRAAIAYVEQNPVRGGIVRKAEDYTWSSALSRNPNKSSKIEMVSVADIDKVRLHTRTGRPLGSKEFVSLAEKITGRVFEKQRPGPKSSG